MVVIWVDVRIYERLWDHFFTVQFLRLWLYTLKNALIIIERHSCFNSVRSSDHTCLVARLSSSTECVFVASSSILTCEEAWRDPRRRLVNIDVRLVWLLMMCLGCWVIFTQRMLQILVMFQHQAHCGQGHVVLGLRKFARIFLEMCLLICLRLGLLLGIYGPHVSF